MLHVIILLGYETNISTKKLTRSNFLRSHDELSTALLTKQGR